MPTVTVEPSGISLEVRPGETVFEAAQRIDMVWPTICYGQTRCTACALTLVEGHENTETPDPEEHNVLRQLVARRRGWSSRDTRLACRLRIVGDITVQKKGVRTADAPQTREPQTREERLP